MRRLSFSLVLALGLTSLHPLPAEELPEDAGSLIKQYQEDEKAIMLEAEQKVIPIWNKLIADLTSLQSAYTKAGDLDNAVAVRDEIKELSIARYLKGHDVRPDPGSINALGPPTPGQVYFIRVTGRTSGSVWGSDMYTTDSTLAAAAVHAGVAKDGIETVIKVTVHPGQNGYNGSTRFGVSSSSWGSYGSSFTIEGLE